MIEIKGLKKSCRGAMPLGAIDLKLKNGGVCGILELDGESGSLLLSLMAGALLPDEGCVRINGFDTVADRMRASRAVGYFSSKLRPYEEMTPEEREEYEKQLRRAEFLRKLKIFLLWFAAILAVSGAVATVVLLAARAEKRRDKRIKRIKAGQFSDDERRSEALWLIDESAALLKLYGLAPRMGEQRDEYAARLLSEMPSVFGQAPQIEGDDKVAPSAFTYPMDPEKIYRDIAAEEFGNGMTKREMHELAEYYSRLRTQKVRFISFPRRWVLHFILHRI